MQDPNLVVVGSVAYDSIETPEHSEPSILGGSATYFSLAARLQDATTGIVAVVGNDFRPEDRRLLADKGVDCRGLEEAQGKTFAWGGRYDADLKDRETLYTDLNVFADFKPRLPEAYKNAPYLFLANIDPDLQHDVLAQCTGPEWVGCDTMNLWIDIKRDSLISLLPKLDMLFINDTEAHQLTGHRSVLAAASWIREKGTPAVVIKRGEYGAVLITETDVFSAPAFLLEDVADPTGAGDSFGGGMAGALAALDSTSGQALRYAAAVGTVTASFCVQSFGPARLAQLDGAQLADRLDAYRKLTSVPSLES